MLMAGSSDLQSFFLRGLVAILCSEFLFGIEKFYFSATQQVAQLKAGLNGTVGRAPCTVPSESHRTKVRWCAS